MGNQQFTGALLAASAPGIDDRREDDQETPPVEGRLRNPIWGGQIIALFSTSFIFCFILLHSVNLAFFLLHLGFIWASFGFIWASFIALI